MDKEVRSAAADGMNGRRVACVDLLALEAATARRRGGPGVDG